jgi:hypothetical protein
LSNGLGIIGIREHFTEAQAQAVESYIMQIQSPSQDVVQMTSRLGWLAHAVDHCQWRRPLVIRGFDFDLFAAARYKNLNWARGSLYQIQNSEFAPGQGENVSTEFFQGIDCRYNHLCLSNHQILGPRVAEALITDSELDLTEGYLSDIMPDSATADPEFAQREWCPDQWELYHQRLKETKLKKFKRWML